MQEQQRIAQEQLRAANIRDRYQQGDFIRQGLKSEPGSQFSSKTAYSSWRPGSTAGLDNDILDAFNRDEREEKSLELLGLQSSATVEEIKTAYRAAAFASHPDSAGAASDVERFQSITQAFDYLTSKRERIGSNQQR